MLGVPCRAEDGPVQYWIIHERSGVDLGSGIVTAVLGAVVLALALITLRTGSQTPEGVGARLGAPDAGHGLRFHRHCRHVSRRTQPPASS